MRGNNTFVRGAFDTHKYSQILAQFNPHNKDQSIHINKYGWPFDPFKKKGERTGNSDKWEKEVLLVSTVFSITWAWMWIKKTFTPRCKSWQQNLSFFFILQKLKKQSSEPVAKKKSTGLGGVYLCTVLILKGGTLLFWEAYSP